MHYSICRNCREFKSRHTAEELKACSLENKRKQKMIFETLKRVSLSSQAPEMIEIQGE